MVNDMLVCVGGTGIVVQFDVCHIYETVDTMFGWGSYVMNKETMYTWAIYNPELKSWVRIADDTAKNLLDWRK